MTPPVYPHCTTAQPNPTRLFLQVIYHLNSANEDHQFEVEAAKKNHEAEVADVVKDAAAKVVLDG